MGQCQPGLLEDQVVNHTTEGMVALVPLLQAVIKYLEGITLKKVEDKAKSNDNSEDDD